MTKNPTAFEKERLSRINYLMGNIHDSTNEIYEGYVDREYEDVKKNITNLIKHLKSVIDSMEDEI